MFIYFHKMLQRTKLTNLIQVSGSLSSIYTNPISTKTHVRGFLTHNTNTSSEAVYIHWVPASQTASSANRLFNFDLIPNETLILEIPYGIVMTDISESIQAKSTTSNVVNISVFGDKDI